MAIRKVLKFPDERLRKTARAVEAVDDRVRRLVNDMFETMYAEGGIGLAATQIDVQQRIFVADVPKEGQEQDSPMCFINPEIVSQTGTQVSEEGCLSVPDFFSKVERAAEITVKALNEKGEPFTRQADERLAVCIQHEIDHLNGKLFVDHLSPLKRQRFMKKVRKIQKSQLQNKAELRL